MAQFDNIIDALDEKSINDFHSKLVENRCYEGLLNVNEIDDSDPNKLREAVKVGIQGAGYEKLKEIGPESIKKEIDLIEKNSNSAINVPPTTQPEEETETKEKLIQELIIIRDQRGDGRGVPQMLRERYGHILTILNEKYGMSYQDIERVSEISRKTVAKSIENYKKEHPIVQPDEGVLKGAEKRAADKLTKVVGATADQIIEDDMELAIHIRQTFLKEAYMRGMSLRQLVDAAIPMFFSTGDIYTTMLSMESENIELRTRVARLSATNRKLSLTLININGFSGGYHG